MHDSAHAWVEAWAQGHWDSVCEIGSRNINGSVRDVIDAGTYLGVDLYDGPDVDKVCDAREIAGEYDLVVCCEVLEHEPDPFGLIAHFGRLVKVGGRVIATAGGIGRGEHSAIDGERLKPGEYYGNLNERHFVVSWGVVLACQIQDYDWRVVWGRTR